MKLLLADLEKENVKYLRKDIDGGILSDKYEIDRYKLEQYNSVVDNLMLGNYNEFGEYVINEELKQELLACRKIIDDNYENILFVKSECKINVFSYLNFAVKIIDSQKQGYKIAILELLEPIYKAKGYIENTQATAIKKIVLPNNEIFKDEVYKSFNIIIHQEGGKKELKDDDFTNIIDRKTKLFYIKKYVASQEDYMICYKKNKSELENSDEGKKILEEYKKSEEIVKKYIGLKDDDYKTRNELLTYAIENTFDKNTFKGKNDDKDNSYIQISKIVKKVLDNVNKLEEVKSKRIQQCMNRINNKDIKSETKQMNNLLNKVKRQVQKQGKSSNMQLNEEETLEIR